MILGAGGFISRAATGRPVATGGVDAVFPLDVNAGGHYIKTAGGNPFPLLVRVTWCILCLDQAGYEELIDDAYTKGFTAIEFFLPHFANTAAPENGNGDLPFTTAAAGGAWSGSTSVSADMSTPNTAYWTHVDGVIDYAAAKGMAVLFFPAYVGVTLGGDGWRRDMVDTGVTKMETYGAWVANRYKNRGNVIWMIGGDYGLGVGYTFSTNETNALQAMIDGMATEMTMSSVPVSNEWHGDSIGTDQTDFDQYITVNGCYSWSGNVASVCRTGYADSPALPAFLQEGPFDLEGPDGINFNAAATQPIRRYCWWAFLGAIGGYSFGNYYIWQANAGYTSYLSTTQTQHAAVLNAFIKSIDWHRLVPRDLGSIGSLITAGGGTINSTDYVAAAATALGDLLVAYRGPGHSSSFTVDMSKLRGTITARWFDPTDGSYTAIGTYANSGTQAFTPSGNNSAGAADWVLRLDA